MQIVISPNFASLHPGYACCLACGILEGLVLLVAVAFTQYVQYQRYIELGKATATTWEKLDGKAKAAINAEMK